MKFSSLAIVATVLSQSTAFAFTSVSTRRTLPIPSRQFMSMDMPDAPAASSSTANIPVLQSRGGAPVDVRYSDFVKLVNADRIEKVTFSADGTQLLGVDTDGIRVKIEQLPNDPDLLTQLTDHKV